MSSNGRLGYTVATGGSGGSGGAVDSVNGKTGSVSITKTDVGLGSVDNTSDAGKPISTAAATALAGKVGKGDLVFNVKDTYGSAGGAICDGVADDTAAIQSVIDLATAGGSGVAAISILVPGTPKITNTLQVSKKSLALEGTGVGNQTFNPSSKGTSLRWFGPAGIPMIQVRDSIRVKISNMRLEGNVTSPPFAGVNSKWLTGDSQGGNHFLELDRVLFSAPDGVSAPAFQHNVAFDGDNGSNDSFRINNCQFRHASTSHVYIPNSQSVTGSLRDCWFMSDFAAIGIETAANVALYNCFFDACTVDVKTYSTAQVDAFGWSSERSQLIAWGASASGTKINVYGGYWLTSGVLNNTFVKHDGCGESGGVNLYGLKIASDGGKKIVAVGSGGATKVGYVTVENCNIPVSALDVTAAASSAGTQLRFSDDGRQIFAHLDGGRRFLGTNDPGADAGIGWRRVTGQYVTGIRQSSAATLMAANVEYAMPVFIDDAGSFANIVVGVSAAGSAASVIRLGIRKSSGKQPGPLLLDAGTVAADATGNLPIAISQAVTPGVYWFTATAQNVSGTAPTTLMMSASSFPIVGYTTMAGALGSTPAFAGYATSATVTGALPGSYTPITVSAVPVVAARWA